MYTAFLAGKSPNIHHQIYGHIRCVHGIFGREITKYTSPNIRSYTVYMHGSGQPWALHVPQADKSTFIHTLFSTSCCLIKHVYAVSQQQSQSPVHVHPHSVLQILLSVRTYVCCASVTAAKPYSKHTGLVPPPVHVHPHSVLHILLSVRTRVCFASVTAAKPNTIHPVVCSNTCML